VTARTIVLSSKFVLWDHLAFTCLDLMPHDMWRSYQTPVRELLNRV